MSQRNSEYERKDRELYETPEWVTEAVLPHLRPLRKALEPCVATGKIARVLRQVTDTVTGIDLVPGPPYMQGDFLSLNDDFDDIVTNPPFGIQGRLAMKFIEHSLTLTKARRGQVAMLLRADFAHGKTRKHIFKDCPFFKKKIELTKRIVWFEPEPGEKNKGPSENHAWFLWDYRHGGPPTVSFEP